MINNVNKNDMKCRETGAALLEAFEEGHRQNLSDELSGHLAACNRCRQEWQNLIQLALELEQMPVPDPGEGFWANFLPRLRWRMEQAAGRRAKDLAWIPSWTAAAVMVLFLLKSPARLAPPSWWEVGSAATTTSNMQLSEANYQRLLQALDAGQTTDSTQQRSEFDFIDQLSQIALAPSQDPLDALAGMSDEDIEAILERLKLQPIIRS